MSSVHCPSCDTAVVPAPPGGNIEMDIAATHAAILDRVAEGRMLLLRADCPLEKSLELLASDTKYTIVHYLECVQCGRTIFWGLSIRGQPIYKHVPREDIDLWRWERSDGFVDNVPGIAAGSGTD